MPPRPPSASPLQRSHLLSCLCQKPGYGPFFVRKQLGDDDAQVTSDLALYNDICRMFAKPIKTIELHSTMIQF